MTAAILYMTPAGYTDRRPVKLPPIDRRALMQNAHRIARNEAQSEEEPREPEPPTTNP